MKRRVVVTGLGAITPLGIGIEPNWEALCQGRSGLSHITRFDATDFRTKIAGEINDFNPVDFMDKKLIHRTGRFIHLAVSAARMAMGDSKLTTNSGNAERVGVAIGTAMGGVETGEKYERMLLAGQQNHISPFFIPSFICNIASGQVAIEFCAKGPNMCPVTACAAGSHAIGDSVRVIQAGEAEAMIAGGTEAAINPIVFAGLDAMRAMSCRNHDPTKASRPFNKDRDGFIVSEGAAVVILEELEFALKRGARIYAEVLGYGHNSDAYHVTAPEPTGEGAANCMKRALSDAGLSIEQIDYINAHGTSTPLNDSSETKAIKTVFQERAKKIPVSANKSMTGHMWGASGVFEAISSILTINRGIIPPTINNETPDPECDLDFVPNVARKADVKIALSNSFGFGSTNATLIFGRYRA